MQEKKGGDMATTKSPKKTNLLDHSSIKHILDESVTEIVKNRGFIEDVRLSNVSTYIVFNGILQLIIHTKEKNAIMFTHPPAGSFTTTGLVVSSKLPRFSDMYTLTIASADPKSVSAKPPVEFTKSVTQWFTKEGVLVEGLFWKDVGGLIKDYDKEAKKSK
ncbi:hypothetical protein RHGRI_036645 [Rhododendron griersonianum]|uniref:Signal peptidase complex subunit 2 n=1 Tax=Rhododendron griersonianum TaxID=479676 RepID=A0AAV6HSL1_9ERIC|nr:hypothetical protein RHGRI_036645 [Rhododendron griersonianum]